MVNEKESDFHRKMKVPKGEKAKVPINEKAVERAVFGQLLQ
jgi:hypothetical protein